MGSSCCCTTSSAEPVELTNTDEDGGKDNKKVQFGGGEDEDAVEEEVDYISEESEYDSEFGYSMSMDLEAKRNKRRNQTFYLLNDSNKQDNCRRSLQDAREFQRAASTISEQEASADQRSEAQKVKDEILERVEEYVDKAYDILPAEMLLADVEKLVEEEEWKNLQASPLFDRFCRKLDYFYDVGISCCQKQEDWMEVYNGENGMQTIHGLIDPEENHVLHYRVRAQIPTKLTNVMAVANEIQLMKTWNSLVVKEPEVIGRRTGHYMVMNYQLSALGGMYKVDVLNEIRRFSDVNGGFLAEFIMSVAQDHPSYKEPEKGYKRMQTEMKNVICACGDDQSVFIQVGKMKLPFAASEWLAKTIGKVAGKFIVGALVTNSLRAAQPGSPWEGHIKEDRLGLYHRLAECIRSPGSTSRDPGKTKDKVIGEFDLDGFFSCRRFYRKSTRRTRRRSRTNSTLSSASRQSETEPELPSKMANAKA